MEYKRLWEDDGFCVLVNMDPPKGTDLSVFLKHAMSYKGRVEGIMVSDSPDGIMRMSPIGVCGTLVQNGIRPLLCINNRDRNRLAIQGDLLSAWNLGIQDVIIEDGKDPSYGDHPLSRPVQDASPLDMVEMVSSLNQGKDIAGNALKGNTDFVFGKSVEWLEDENSFRKEFLQMQQAANAGVELFVISPQFDISRTKTQVAMAKKFGKAILIGIMIIKSVGMARYLNEVPGISKVPEDVIGRMSSAPVKAKAGIDIAAEMISELRGIADGVVIWPLGWEHKVPTVLDAIGR